MGVNGIYGLSGSGLDVESMVKMGMLSKESQYNKMQQTYTLNEWKKDAYLEIYDKVNEYNNNTLSKYKLSSNMNTRSATSSNSAIKATANASAPVMNHTITVNNTATNAYLLGTQSLDSTTLKGLTYKYTTEAANGETSTTTINLFDNNDSDSNVISFTIGGNSSTGVTQAAEYATVSFSSTALSSASKAKNLLESALASYKGLVSLDKISVSGDNVYFTGLKQSGTDTVTATIPPIAATGTALTFTMSDGTTNNKKVNITYGDLAAVLNDEDADFQDFVNLLNKKMAETPALNIKASYDEDKGFVFKNSKADSSNDKVSVTMDSGGMAQYIAKAVYEAGDHTHVSNNGSYSFIEMSDTATPSSFTSGSGKTVKLTVGSSTSVYDLVSEINKAGTSVRATFDATNNSFSFYNTKTGEANSIAIKANNDDTANLLNAMGLKDTGAAADLTKVDALNFTTSNNHVVSGKNASVLVDGELITNIESNNFERKGVTYDISNVTSKTSSTVSVSQDIDKIVDNVKSFVEDYNKLLDELYTAYRETPNKSYKPLTEAQKNEMTEDQIKKWEEKAKAGMLYHDSTIRSIIDNMRNAISESVTSLGKNATYDSAYKIGISTTGLYGQLQLDEDKLRAALVDDSDSVYNVFAKLDSTTTDASDAKNGIAQRLTGGIGSVFYKATESIKSISGTSSDISDDSSLNVLLRNLQTRMSNFKSMMNAFENSLYKKYDAMESALASLGTQMNYVSSMFAS